MGCIICLSDPDILRDGWEDSTSSYPHLLQSGIETYFDRSKQSMRICKPSLFLRKYSNNAQYLPVSIHNYKAITRSIQNTNNNFSQCLLQGHLNCSSCAFFLQTEPTPCHTPTAFNYSVWWLIKAGNIS